MTVAYWEFRALSTSHLHARFYCLLAAFWASVFVAFLCPQQAQAETRRISSTQMLRMLLQRNPSLLRERLTIEQAHADVNAARGAFAFDLELGLSLDRSNLPADMQVNPSLLSAVGDLDFQTLRVDGSLLLSKRFETGTIVSMNYRSWWRQQDQLDFAKALQGSQDPLIDVQNASNTLLFQVVQPLLKGAWFETNLAAIRQAQERVSMAHQQVKRLTSQLVLQAISYYWDLVYARQNIAIKRSALALAKKELISTLALIKAGKRAAIEKYQIKQVLAAREAEVLIAQDLIEQAETQLRILLHLPVTVTLIPTESPEQMRTSATLTALMRASMKRHPDIVSAMHALKVAQLGVVSSKNATLPELNLQAGFTFVGFGRKSSDQTTNVDPIGRSFGTMFDPRSNSFQVGITFKVPLDNRTAKNRLIREQIEIRRAQMQIMILRRKVALEVQQLYRNLRRAKLRMPISKASVVWAKKKLVAEREKLKADKSTLFAVLQYQQDLATAQLTIVKNWVDYQKVHASLLEKTGALLKAYNIVKK
ncbi:MAG TPA: hypothetical protein DCE42_28275 [Myxococcales bacterium]|nr:hypothetical protein [Deltaproteobacteria bacterium]MBU48302.1 hypothetical protein [Deltaproteobacteria bacterium]HAA58692.1 hypothetical protein [Myxococcales bacterium]